MKMTLAEKLIAAHAGKEAVEPGELVTARVDLVLANDITAPIAIKEFNRIGAGKVFDPSKIILLNDHFCPNKDILSAENARTVRLFNKKHGMMNVEVGQMGIEHALLPEKGWVLPGELVIGADSHTCTYGALGAFSTGMGSTDIAYGMAFGDIWMRVPQTIRFVYRGRLNKWVGGKDLILFTIGKIGVDGANYAAMEFTGEAVSELSMDGRFTMANMAVEAGAKAGLFEVDRKTIDYVKPRAQRPYKTFRGDEGARRQKVFDFDVSNLKPQVAFPHLPSNTRPIDQVGDIKVDQAVIGSCTNGRLDDLRTAAGVLRGNRVHPDVRCVIIPATQQIYMDALKEGLIETFIQAGAAVSTPTCGPCLGGHMGVLAAGERCISTTNRNFVGRMGSPGSELYLANPAVAAASAVLGRIAGPEEVVHGN